MIEVKHTPGPWTTDEDDHDAPHQNIKVKAGKHRTVCTVWIDDAPVRDFNAEQQANARLIAAAPELLEYLQYAVWAHPELEKNEKLMVVIAKATGTKS